MPDLFLGIDGGGTKTAGVLCDHHGKVLAHYLTGSSAILGAPGAEPSAVLAALVDELCAQAEVTRGEITHCGIGLNGVDFEDEYVSQHEGVAKALGLDAHRLALVNDGIVALWGATPSPAAAIIQHGTGLTSACRRDYGEEALFDNLDVGRIFDLRREVVSRVARMIDGRLPETPLANALLGHFGISERAQYAELMWRRRVPAERLVSTPPLVFHAWLTGDPAAAELVESAVEDYALTARAMVERIGLDIVAVAFGGGVLSTAPTRFWERLAEALKRQCPQAAVTKPRLPPEYGAVVMAAHQAGREPQPLFAHLAGAATK